MKNKIGIIALIGIALYYFLRNKNNVIAKRYLSKVGARLRKLPSTTSEILKTFSKETELKLIMIKKENDGNWYLVQELFPVGTISPSGENVGGNVMWTGWIREDVIKII